jgi:thioesterase domain-containing protein
LGAHGKNLQEELRQFIEKDVVVLNQEISNWKKIFCFPSGIGCGIVYKNLASMFSGYSFYAMSFIEDPRRIEKYVEIITRLHIPGPYRLLGYSAGWKLAFQVARALENHGFEVSDIILFDSFWPEPAISVETGDTDGPLSKMVGKYLHDLGMHSLKNSIIEKMRKYKVYWSAPFRPEVVKANIHLILAESNQDKDRANCWEPFTTGGTLVYQGVGEHAAMLTAGFLEKNAEILREILDNIG